MCGEAAHGVSGAADAIARARGDHRGVRAEASRDWLSHCEGFHVDGPSGFIGWVERVELDAAGRASALLVRRHHVDELERLPATAVVEVAPKHGRVLIVDPRLLRPRGLEFRCSSCGYGVTLGPPERCPMCGGGRWDASARPPRPLRARHRGAVTSF